MTTTTKKRAYGKLREIVEQRGGSMTYDGRGLHGAWVIILGSKRGCFQAMGGRTFPKLDSLFVPAVADPKTWDDYHDELVPDAEKKLYDLLDDVA
jgi:hypothetical protein